MYRALRLLPKGLEALYPLAGVLGPVNRFFLDPALRSDEALQQSFLRAPAGDNMGVMRLGEKKGAASGFTSRRTMLPSAPGRWSWHCMAAVALGACFCGLGCAMPAVVAPSGGADIGWEHLGTDGRGCGHPQPHAHPGVIASRWKSIADAASSQGCSDGGTFTNVSGTRSGVTVHASGAGSASFHPLLAQMADANRTRGLPVP